MHDEAFESFLQGVNNEIEASVASLVLHPDLVEAVRHMESEEEKLRQQLVQGELSREDFLTQWSELMDRYPEEVQLAGIKLTRAMIQALDKLSSAPDA